MRSIIAGGSCNLLEEARVLIVEWLWAGCLANSIVFPLVPGFPLPPLWPIFPVSKNAGSHGTVSEQCREYFRHIWQTQRRANIMDRLQWYSDKFSVYSWTLNVIFQNVTLEPLFRFGVCKSKTEFYRITLKFSWICVVNFSKYFSALLLQQMLRYCSLDAHTPKSPHLITFSILQKYSLDYGKIQNSQRISLNYSFFHS